MRVTLVNPPYVFWKPETQYLKPLLGQMPPLGLLSIAGYTRAHMPDADITLLDAAAQNLSTEETATRIQQSSPDVLGLTMTTMAARNAHAVAAAVRESLPATCIVAGGPHVSGSGEKALMEAPAFDLGVVGEGEETFLEVLDAVRRKRPVGGVPGLIYREDHNGLRRTPPRPLIDNLDALPQPPWDLLREFPKAYEPNVFFSPGGPAASLVTSRGCPFSCRFCDQSTFGRKYRAFSEESVFAAVQVLQEKHGIRYIVFADDTFTLDRDRVLRLCGLLRRHGRRLVWSCDANVMTVDREMLRAMKAAGCWCISYGIESGSQRVLESLSKRIKLDRAREAVRATHAVGIHAKGLFIVGTPEESEETLEETRRFISAVPLSTINLSKFTPYPGSSLHAEVAAGVRLDPRDLDGMHFVLPSKRLSIGQLEREYDRLMRHFFSTRRSWTTHLPILLGRWENMVKVARIIPAAIRARFRARRRNRTKDANE